MIGCVLLQADALGLSGMGIGLFVGLVLLVLIGVGFLAGSLAASRNGKGDIDDVDDENMDYADGVPTAQGSYFDGSTSAYIGWHLLGGLLSAVTWGIAFPWAMCMVERWKASHTVIDGRRMRFTGRGSELFGKYMLWSLLTAATFGVYSLWLGVNLEKWKAKHTVYADGKSEYGSYFSGGVWGWFIHHFLCGLLSAVTFGIAYPWGQVHLLRWKAANTVIGGSPLVFEGTGGGLFVKHLACVLLTPLTLGIYMLFYPVKLLKWQTENTVALSNTNKITELSCSHEEAANLDFARFRLAANDAELAAIKSGFTGKETPEELDALVQVGNPYACYVRALQLKGGQSTFEGDALELLKQASDAGHYSAIFAYAQTVRDPEEKTALLEKAARKGNASAPWVLKDIYMQKANGGDKKAKLENLTKAAYWYKIALNLEDRRAIASQGDYEALLESIAVLNCLNKAPAESNNMSGAVVVAVGAVMALAGVALLLTVSLFRPTAVPEPNPTATTGIQQTDLHCKELILDTTYVLFEQKGDGIILQYKVEPAYTSDAVTFRSENDAVATVSAGGKLTAVGEGTTVIKVTCGRIIKQCTVVCRFSKPTEPPVTTEPSVTTDPTETTEPTKPAGEFRLNRSDITFSYKGEKWDLYSGTIAKNLITWTSDDPSVVTFENGVATAVGPGQTQIHAEYQGQRVSCLIRCSFRNDGGVAAGGVTEAGTSAAPTDPSATYHTVTAGDTLSAIAAKYGISVTALIEYNHLSSYNSLEIGQVLAIPPQS